MTHQADNAAGLTPELRAELMRSMKAAIEQALSEMPSDLDAAIPESPHEENRP